MRVAAIVLAAMTLLGLTCAGATYYWWQQQGAEMFEGMQIAAEEGLAVGITTDQSGCLDEGLARMETCGEDLNCALAGGTFFGGCWKTAAQTPGFCDDASTATEQEALALWAEERCTARGRSGQPFCLELVGAIAEQCRQDTGA